MAHERSSPALPRAFAARLATALCFVLTLAGLSAPAIHAQTSRIVYVQTNDPRPNQNSLLLYNRNSDGSLSQLGGPFLTRGTGFANPASLLGPNDADKSLIASADGRFLFAVNGGSNTIAVMRINSNGSLTHVPGSPFLSRGVQPGSLALTGNKLYVSNMNQDPGQGPNTFPPNYFNFSVNADGSLVPNFLSKVESPIGAVPTQVLVTPDQKILFALNLNIDFISNPPNLFPTEIRMFKIQANGTLAETISSQQIVPPDATPPPQLPLPPVGLGLAAHPTRPILYVGFVGSNRLGVYGYNSTTGLLSFVRSVPNSGLAICWLNVTKNGGRLFSTNTADASVSSYSLANPLVPVETQTLILKDRGPAAPPGLPNLFSSGPFQFALDVNDQFLYVTTHRVTTDPTVTAGNAIHIIKVAADGTMTEPFPTLALPIPINARPGGIVAF